MNAAAAVAANGELVKVEEREAQKSYWEEHSRDLTVEAMMLDSRAADLDKEERPEVMTRVEEMRAAGPLSPVNLSVMLHGLTNSIVSRAAFGKKRKNAPEFLAAIKTGVGLSSGFNIPDLFPVEIRTPRPCPSVCHL